MSNQELRNRSVAIVGAGMAGLSAAGRLALAGRFDLHVFDKARGVGGRTSLRRVDRASGDRLTFDHGAQYFTARDPRFREQVDLWIEDGVVAPWEGRVAVIDESRPPELRAQDTERFVGVPGMNAMAKAMAGSLGRLPHHGDGGIQIEVRARVQEIRRRNAAGPGGPYALLMEDGRVAEGFDSVIVTAPPAQAAPLVAASAALSSVAKATEMRPCWAVMVAFHRPLDAPFDGAFINGGPLSWACRNSSKEGRGGTDSWVLHATPEWTAEHLELDRSEATRRLLDAFAESAGLNVPGSLAHADAHRWMYSGAHEPRTDGCLFDEELGLGLAGDWLNGAKVQGAWLSGLALAERMIAARA